MSFLAMNQQFPHDAVVNRAINSNAIAVATLENGATVIAKDSNSPVASIQVAITKGSGAETISQQGAATFLAYSALAGNEVNTGSRITKFFDNLGVKVTANATANKIVYNIVTLKDNAEPALVGLLNAISTPPYANHVYDEFMPTPQVFQENKKCCPIINLTQVLAEAAYGENSGYGRSTLVDFSDLSAEDILAFREANFTSNNLVVAGSGVSLDLIKDAVTKYNTLLPANNAAPAQTFLGGAAKLRSDADKAYVGVSYSNTGVNATALAVLEEVLSQRGVSVINSTKGLFGFFAADNSEENLVNKISAAVKELKSIAQGNLNDEEFTKATNKVTINNYEKLNNITTSSAVLVDLFLSQSKEDALDARKIKKDEIVNIVKKFLKEPVAYGAYGATAYAPSYTNVLKIVA